MHEHSDNSGPQAQNASVEQNPSTSSNLRQISQEVEDLELEEIGNRDVAIERNAQQTLVYVETESASIVAAVDVTELTLAEVIEQADQIGEPFEFLAKGPVFASDGGAR